MMFGFGLQARTAECVRRGGQALFLGTYINQQAITQMPLNEEAQAALYYYTAALCLHDLFEQMKASSLSGQKAWCTIDFFMENALAGIERFERERHLPKGALAAHCIAPLGQIGEYVEQGGTVPVQIAAAEVQLIHEGKLSYTSHQDAVPIREFMADCKEKFHADTAHMFT